MHPRASDGYKWSVLPQSQHLFRQNLSKLTSREYQQIIQCIGVSLEAVPNDASSSKDLIDDDTRRIPSSDIPVNCYANDI